MTKKSSVFSSLFGQLNRFDSYAPVIRFTLAKEDSVPSVIGGLISLVTTFFAFYLSWKNLYDFIFNTNAEVIVGSRFENSNLKFDSETMFLSLGFYFPHAQSSGNLEANSEHSFNVEGNIKNINLTCVDCNNENTVLSRCKPDKFKNILINSMPFNQSNQIINNLKKYSFCLPHQYSGNVVEEIPFGKSASIEMEMPFDRTIPPKKPEDAAKLIQTGGYSFNSVKTQVQQLESTRNQMAEETKQKQEQAISEYQDLLNTGYNPDHYKGNSCYPGDDICSEEHYSKIKTNKPNSAQNSTFASANGSYRTKENTAMESNNKGKFGNKFTKNQNEAENDEHSEDVLSSNYFEKFGSLDDPLKNDFTGPLDSGSTRRMDAKLDSANYSSSKRSLTQNCSCMQASDYLRTANLPWELKQLVDANMFPKLLFLHRTITVSPVNQNVVSFVYRLNILDFYDRFTSNPIVYDIYVRKVVVEKITGIFWQNVEEFDYLEFKKIEANKMDTLTNKGARFYFKISSDVKTITVKYVTFADWFESFGAYMAVFSIMGGSLIGIFSKHILYQKAISTIFKFNANRPSNFKTTMIKLKSKENINLKTSRTENRYKKVNFARESSVIDNSRVNSRINQSAISDYPSSLGIRDETPGRSLLKDKMSNVKFKKSFVLNRKKKQELRKLEISLVDMLKAAWCRSCFKRQKGKFEIMDKCAEIIEECVSVEYTIKKFFELNLIKKIFFSKYERGLLKYQIRYLNVADKQKTLDYMQELSGEKFKLEELEKLRREDTHEYEDYLINYLENYYAF